LQKQVTNAVKARKMSAEYAEWIDSYRKWRLWSKKD